jgi:hypothetical protein
MDARVRTGDTASNQPAGAGPAGGSCPPGTTAGGATGYSASMGDVGMSDFAEEAKGAAGANGHGAGHSPGEAFREAGARLGELKEFASYYVAAKLDAWKVSVRNLGMYAALGIVGLITASAIITTAAVLLLVGIAWGLGALLWHQYWLGALLVGLLVLGGIGGGIIFFMKRLTSTARKQLVEKYENRQRDQRINFGEDVRGRRAGVDR